MRKMLLFCFLLNGCFISKPEQAVFKAGDEVVKPLWSKQLGGGVTDLVVSNQNNGILVSNLLPEAEGSQLTLFSPKGETIWSRRVQSRIKSMDLGMRAELAVVSSVDGVVTAFDHFGRELWSYLKSCRPMVLREEGKVLCHFADTHDPGVAFDLITRSGKKESTFEVEGYLEKIEFSADRSVIALALSEGSVVVLDSKLQVLGQTSTRGRVLDLGVHTNTRTVVGYLVNIRSHETRQREVVLMSGFTSTARRLQFEVDTFANELAFSKNGQSVLLYGNSQRGQYLGAWSMSGEKWKVSHPHFSDFSSPLGMLGNRVIVGFSRPDAKEGNPQNSLRSFDNGGQMRWEIPIGTTSGAYLFANGESHANSILVLATDDHRLDVYGLGRAYAF